MTPTREPRRELDALYGLLTDKGLATESELRARGLPVGEPATVLIHVSPRAAKILSQFTDEAGAWNAPYRRTRYRWGDEVELLLGLARSENTPDLPAGSLKDRDRAGRGGGKMRVTQPVRDELEKHRPAALAAFSRSGSPRERVSLSDIAEYLAERVLAGRTAHEQTGLQAGAEAKGSEAMTRPSELDTKRVIRYIVPFAHPGNFQAGSILTTYGGDAQTVIRPDGTVELVNDEPCRDLFMHDVDEGQFECELPKGHSERHRVTGETWDNDSESWIDWEIVWERRLSDHIDTARKT